MSATQIIIRTDDRIQIRCQGCKQSMNVSATKK